MRAHTHTHTHTHTQLPCSVNGEDVRGHQLGVIANKICGGAGPSQQEGSSLSLTFQRGADEVRIPLPPYTLHLTPYTLRPTPYTLHPTPYTLHLTPHTPE